MHAVYNERVFVHTIDYWCIRKFSICANDRVFVLTISICANDRVFVLMIEYTCLR